MIDSTVFSGKKAAYFTLGCKLNFAETSTIAQKLKELGVRNAHSGEVADICVINTCSVTETADHKCRQAIHKLIKKHPGAYVVVIGCYAQLRPDVLSQMEGVDLVLGAEQKGDLLHYLSDRLPLKCEKESGFSGHEAYVSATKDIRSFMPSCSCGDRTRYFIKVQDGCDYYCTYCTIPHARGRSRNASIGELVSQAKKVALSGGKEIVLTGVNIGDFGKTTGESFIDLLRAFDEVEGIERYRISSIEPNLLTDEIIEFCAASRAFMPHFHIPLQSGSNEVLRLMRRRYTTELFADKIRLIKQFMPQAFIGVDIIVGARGETDACFHDAYQFIESLDISQLHVFSYSERPGTMALNIDHKVPAQEKRRRSQMLLDLSTKKWEAFYKKHIGLDADVLLEHSRMKGMMHGYTDNYIKVEVPVISEVDNRIVRVRLGDFNDTHTALKAIILNNE